MDFINNQSRMALVDMGTGDIADMEINPGDVVRVIRATSIEARQTMSKEYVNVNTGRKFVKVFPDMAQRLSHRLTPNELWVLNALLPYIGMNSGILKHRNGEMLSRRNIVDICGDSLSPSTVDRSVKRLIEKGVLCRCIVADRNAYIVNPYIYQNGSKANATLLALFKETEWAV